MKGLSRCRQLGSLLLGVALCVLLAGCGNHKLTKGNFDKVKNGMSEAQVTDLLGPATAIQGGVEKGGKTLVWKSGTIFVTVHLKDDKVNGKMHNFDPLGK